MRLAVGDSGGEIISAMFRGEEIQYETIRLFGLRPWDYPNVDRAVRQRFAARLLGSARAQLQLLATDNGIQAENGRGFRVLAAMAGYVGGTVGSTPLGGDLVPDPPTDTVTPEEPPTSDSDDRNCANGCGPEPQVLNELIPDGTWGACCDVHDNCYCSGDCKTCDRLECDNQFFGCLLQGQGVPVAMIYYLFVRAFGGFGPYECPDDPKGIGGLSAVAIGAVVGIVVGLVTGIPTGIGAGVTAAALASLLLCNICEPVYELRESLQETMKELISWERIKKAVRRCRRKKSWWKRFTCRVKAIVGYIFSWIWVLSMIPWLLILWTLELVACGS